MKIFGVTKGVGARIEVGQISVLKSECHGRPGNFPATLSLFALGSDQEGQKARSGVRKFDVDYLRWIIYG